ncbi:YadA family autotransporter adhesin, partial [Burkholderia stagnalis]
GAGSIALGSSAVANNANDVALGSGSVTAAANPTASATINGTTYVLAGASPTSVVSVGAPGAERQITNVAAGRASATSTDAVNGSQLYATNQAVDSLGNTVNNIVNGGGIKYFHANSTLPDSQALGTDSVAIGPNAVANNAGDVALGSGSTTAAANPTASATIGGASYTFAGATPVSVVSVGAPGAERQVTNVAAGRVTASSTDAVNGSQLYTTIQAINSLSTSTMSNIASLSTSQGTSTTLITSLSTSISRLSTASTGSTAHYVSVNDAGSQQGNFDNTGATGTNAVAIGANAIASQANSVALGNGASANSDGGTVIGAKALVSGSNATAIGQGAAAMASGAVALGANSMATEANTVSVGAPGSERRITNVAAGVNPTDAVNVSQLGAVQSSVNDVARKAYAGVAAATALTMIPEVDAGKTIAVGIGSASYQGYSAVAIGFTARLTDNLKLKGGVGGGSAGYTYGVGVGYQW